jgi:hypothetical protein
MRLAPRRHVAVALVLFAAPCLRAAAPAWTDMPPAGWQGPTRVEVVPLKRAAAAAIALPTKEAAGLTLASAQAVPAGLYEVRVTLRPSHVGDVIAFHSGVRVRAGGGNGDRHRLGEQRADSEPVPVSAAGPDADWPGRLFARAHQTETRTVQIVHAGGGPLRLAVEAYADAVVCEKAFSAAGLKKGGPKVTDAIKGLDDDGTGAGITAAPAATPAAGDLKLTLAPEQAVYFVVDKAEYRPLSRGGRVVRVEIDRIRYAPGATLRGAAIVADVGGAGAAGTLNVYLEHGLADRVKVASLPVTLPAAAAAGAGAAAAAPKAVAFEIVLPKEEIGYAVVAEFASADRADRSEAAEYFNVAADFNRVALFGADGLGHCGAGMTDAEMNRHLAEARAEYTNAVESFAWAEEDMVAMSPESDYWFSGQTCYHMSKASLQRAIRLSHEQGIARASYAKFVMSGYVGWKTAYDYPADHRGQYVYPVGMWEGVNVPLLDRFRNKEFAIYDKSGPPLTGNPFKVWWQAFLPINPDATPRMTRIAAEEVVRSARMFGWDGVRWDGHPRGGGQCGGAGKYDAPAARRTQTLVRYFKDIVGAAGLPAFGHGYNYFFIQDTPSHDWAYEDFELDELCRGGGLLMNESIGNSSAGRTFEFIARNLQVEGDLCRQRGGYLLGISYARTQRDVLIESALWSAGGARFMGGVGSCMEAKRYCTRYSQYTMDERLRRLETPEKVLAPQAATGLWWQPFVYETPQTAQDAGKMPAPQAAGGKRQLVVNFLNIPRQAKRPGEIAVPDWTMPPGSEPVAFALTLPPGLRATGVSLIDPYTLAVTPLPLTDGRFEVPPVAVWAVAVIDLAADAGAPSLGDLYGPPKTFGVPRPGLTDDQRRPQVVLDPAKDHVEFPQSPGTALPGVPSPAEEQSKLDALPPDQRNARILEIRAKNTPESLLAGWWKGGSLPADLALKDKPPAFGDLAPRRNGRLDVYYARGAMDYRLRVGEALAGVDRVAVHDAPLMGGFRAGGGHWLEGAVAGRRFGEFDVLLYTAIPHCAMGADNCYAMVQYVRAGGAVLLTGGEYAFGKGGYNYTVLERELLPVLCAESVDTRVSPTPLTIEPGKDLAELKAAVDFAPRPAMWVWNQVALKSDPGVKVFLRSGNRPVLVGWQVGRGRVACLLVDHRGKSDKTLGAPERDATAFFDWADWPVLLRAVLAWLAPQAMETDAPAAPRPAGETAELLKQLQAEGMEADLGGGEPATPSPSGDQVRSVPVRASSEDRLTAALQTSEGPDAPTPAGTRDLSGPKLQKRLAIIDRLLQCPGPEVASALAGQLAAVGTMPSATQYAILDMLRVHPVATATPGRPANLAATAKACLASVNPSVRGIGLQLLAMAGEPAFATEVTAPPRTMEIDAVARQRDLALALALYARGDLAAEGRRRVEDWNKREQAGMLSYTGGAGFSLAAPEVPCLDAEALLHRVAWLAYLARQDAKAFGPQFVREWLMTAQYQDYCDRSIANLYSDHMTAADTRKAKLLTTGWQRLRAYFGRLRDLTAADAEALARQHPDQAAEGLAKAHFTLEYRVAMNLLGNLPRRDAATAAICDKLRRAANADVAAFAAARALK